MTVTLDRVRNHAAFYIGMCDRWGCDWTTHHPSDRVCRARLRAHAKSDHPPLENVPLPFD